MKAVIALETYGQIIQRAWWNLTHRLGLADIADILIVTVIIYQLIMLIRQTRSSAVLKGLILLIFTTAVSTLLGMTALNWMMMVLINNGALVLIVLFQPELRKALESLGRNRFMTHGLSAEETERQSALREIVTCLQDLSRRRVGALIVIERSTGLQDIIETGTAVDARISAPLLENIFEPNTPLHDGAVIIRDLRVVSAACILPLTESDTVSRDLGTRHRASIGISETTDAVALIVSEETGIISVARGGRLSRHQDAESLNKLLNELYEEPTKGFRAVFRHREKEAKEGE
jgi:diadenylate cyclase